MSEQSPESSQDQSSQAIDWQAEATALHDSCESIGDKLSAIDAEMETADIEDEEEFTNSLDEAQGGLTEIIQIATEARDRIKKLL